LVYWLEQFHHGSYRWRMEEGNDFGEKLEGAVGCRPLMVPSAEIRTALRMSFDGDRRVREVGYEKLGEIVQGWKDPRSAPYK